MLYMGSIHPSSEVRNTQIQVQPQTVVACNVTDMEIIINSMKGCVFVTLGTIKQL